MDEDAQVRKYAPLLEDELRCQHIWYSCEPVLDRKNGKVLDVTHIVDKREFLFFYLFLGQRFWNCV